MNWGGFAGGFAQGFNNGIAIGNAFKDAKKESERQKIYEAGIAESKAMQQKGIEDSITDNGAPKAEAPKASAPAQPDAAAKAAVVPDTPEVQTSAVPTPQTTVTNPAPVGPAAGIGGTAAAQPVPQPVPAPAPTMGPPSDAPAEPMPQPAPQAAPAGPAAPAAPQPVAAQGIVPPQKRFTVKGVEGGFDTREEALAAASKKAPSITDYFVQTAVPKMQEWYIANGDVENAEKLGQYIESKRGQAAVKSFGAAMQKLMFSNDVNGGVQALGDYYNKYIDDGVDFTKGEVMPDGRINITVKRKNDGTETQMQLSKAEIVRMGMAHDPAQLFKMGLAQVEASEKQAAEIAKERRGEAAEIRKENRGAVRDIAKEERAAARDQAKAAQQHDYDIEKLVTGEKLKELGLGKAEKAKVQAKIDILKENGLSPDAIRELVPHMVGGDGYKKSTTPEEARRMLHTERVKDPMYSRKSAAEQKAIIDQDMSTIYGTGGGATPSAKDSPTTPGAAAPAGTYYTKHPRTGEIGIVKDGKFTPLK